MGGDSTTFASRLEEDQSLEDMLRQHRETGVQFYRKTWDEATLFQKFSNQDQWPEGDKQRMDQSANKPARVTFDRISPILQAFSGRQVMQRLERGYIARHPGAARQAEIMTAVDRAFMHAARAEQVESAAFKDGPGIQGISAIRWELDTLNERGGGLLLTDIPIWNCIADPEARSVNLGDRAWHRYGMWWAQTAVKDRWPEKYRDIVNSGGGKAYVENDTGDSSRIPWAGMEGNKPFEGWYYPKARSLWIEYEEWREARTVYEVGKPVDPSMSYADARAAAMQAVEGSPDTMDTATFESWSELRDFKDQHRAVFAEEVPRELIVKKQELVYKYAYICGDTILETDVVPTGYWTIQFLTGFRFPLAKEVRWKSLVSRLIDPQKWINVMMSALIRNLQVSPKGLLFVEKGFFRNRNAAMASWASPGGLIEVERGKLTSGQKGYEFVAGGTSPYQGMVESLLTFYKDALPEIAGFNPGALGQLGSDLRRISGEVVRQVQDAAMTSNAEPFDALRLQRWEGGVIFLSFLRTFFEVADIIRIVGEDVAYETVTEPIMQPVLDAMGRPQIDPATNQPVMQPLIDEITFEPLTKPVIDPATGKPQRILVLPDKSMWHQDSWKEITTEDVAPVTDQLQVLWKNIETVAPTLLQPQVDTGMPILTSDIIIEILPGIPSHIREKMRQQNKAAKARRQQQQAAMAMQAQQAPQQQAPQQPQQQPQAA